MRVCVLGQGLGPPGLRCGEAIVLAATFEHDCENGLGRTGAGTWSRAMR